MVVTKLIQNVLLQQTSINKTALPWNTGKWPHSRGENFGNSEDRFEKVTITGRNPNVQHSQQQSMFVIYCWFMKSFFSCGRKSQSRRNS